MKLFLTIITFLFLFNFSSSKNEFKSLQEKYVLSPNVVDTLKSYSSPDLNWNTALVQQKLINKFDRISHPEDTILITQEDFDQIVASQDESNSVVSQDTIDFDEGEKLPLNQLNFCRNADCQPHDESAEPTEFAGEYHQSEETIFDDDLMAIPNDLTPLSGW